MGHRRLGILLSGGAAILAVGMWSVSRLVSQPIGRSSMNIQVSLSIGRTSLIAGELTSVTIKVTNISNETIVLPDLTTSSKWPKLRLRDMQTGKDVVYGPNERPDPHADDFVPQLPPTTVPLAPGHDMQRTEDLYAWVGPLHSGRYELAGLMTYAESSGKSPVVVLRIDPALVESSYTVGPDSGHGNFRNTFWVSKNGNTNVALLTVYAFNDHGHANVSVSKRIAEMEKPLRLIPSITPNGLPYPSQWIVALDGQNLYTLFLKQAQVTSPLRSTHLALSGPAAVVGPVLLDLEGNDGSRPGRGLVPLWENGKIGVWTIQADGTVQAGPQFPVEQGELRWGANVWLSKGERRILVAISRGGHMVVEMLRWTGGNNAALTKIGEFAGEAVGGGMTLSNDDQLHGGIVLRNGSDYTLQTWAVDPSGAVTLRPANKLQFALPVKIAKADVILSANGAPFVLMEGNDRQQFWSVGKGIVNGIAPEIAKAGVPIDGFWLSENSPFLVMAGPDTGITYKLLR